MQITHSIKLIFSSLQVNFGAKVFTLVINPGILKAKKEFFAKRNFSPVSKRQGTIKTA